MAGSAKGLGESVQVFVRGSGSDVGCTPGMRCGPVDPTAAAPSGLPCGARLSRGLAQTRFAQTVASPDPRKAALLGAAEGIARPAPHAGLGCVRGLRAPRRADAPRPSPGRGGSKTSLREEDACVRERTECLPVLLPPLRGRVGVGAPSLSTAPGIPHASAPLRYQNSAFTPFAIRTPLAMRTAPRLSVPARAPAGTRRAPRPSTA